MNGKKAKLARRIAREEMANDPTPAAPRELVITRFRGHDRVINHPFSVHSFGKRVKEAYKKSQRGAA